MATRTLYFVENEKLTDAQGDGSPIDSIYSGHTGNTVTKVAVRITVYKNSTKIGSTVTTEYTSDHSLTNKSINWSCPSTSLNNNDEIKVFLEVGCYTGSWKYGYANDHETFISARFRGTALASATWTFEISCKVENLNSTSGRITAYWNGPSTAARSRIRWIDYTPYEANPSISTSAASNITKDSANLNCSLLSNDGGSACTVRVYWGESDGETTALNWDSYEELTGKWSDESPSTMPVTLLTPNKTYYYRAWAENSTGSLWASSTLSFTTLTDTPVGVTLAAQNISGSGARIRGQVTDDGYDTGNVDGRFRWRKKVT